MTRRGFLRAGAVLGALLTCAPVLGMIGSMLGMSRALHTLGKNGISDPHELSRNVAQTMMLTAGGLALFPCGIVLLTVCIVLLRRSRGAAPPPLPRFLEGAAKNADRQ